MALSTTIKSIQDIMRKDVGVDGDAQRIGQLVWMLFLKIYDDREREQELLEDKFVSPIPAALRWRSWAQDDEGITGDALLDFVNNKLFPTLKELTADGHAAPRAVVVREVFADAYNYMKNGTLMRQVINKLNADIDFNDSKKRHALGEIYEQVLRDLQSAGNAGEYYTPRAVTQFAVDMVNPQLGESILDPACGTGGFLTCAVEHLRKQVKTPRQEQKLQASMHGVEKKQLPHLLCTTNMILHGVDAPTSVLHDNALSRPLRDYGERDQVDVVLTNPPFGGMEEDGIETNFPTEYRTRETADLFLVMIIKRLKQGGRAAVVLPDGTLFGEGIKTRIKRRLLEECNLHTVVRLPKGVFAPYTSIRTNLLFFAKGEPTRNVWFYEHPYPPGLKSYSKSKPLTIKEFDPEKKWWTKRKETDHAWKVSIKEIEARNYNLDFKNPRAIEDGPGAPDELLKQYEETAGEVTRVRDELRVELRSALDGEAPESFGVAWRRVAKNFERLVASSAAVAPLRRSIIGLAMQGRLVRQESEDGPISDLLTIVGRDRSWRVAERESKVKLDPNIEALAGQLQLPAGWAEPRLNDFAQLINGRAYAQHELLSAGTPVIRIQNLNGGSDWYYSNLDLPERQYCDSGDLLFAWSASFGPYIWTGPRAIYHYHIWKIRLSPAVDKRFMYYALLHLTDVVKAQSHGLAMLHMTKGQMERWPMQLPPHAEQKRIVDRTDAMMRLCDRLEEQLRKQEGLVSNLCEAAFRELAAEHTTKSPVLISTPLSDSLF